VPSTRKWDFAEVAGVFANQGLNLDAMYNSDKRGVYHCFLSKVDQAVLMEEASVKGFNLVGSNVFSDEEDNIWEAVDTASGKVLIKKTDISAHQILNSLKARGEVASIDRRTPMEEKTKAGDFVVVFDTLKGKERSGFVSSKNTLFDIKSKEFASFSDKQVVCVVDNVYQINPTTSKEEASRIYNYNKSLFEEVNSTALSIVKVA
jgi:hypothetical protein